MVLACRPQVTTGRREYLRRSDCVDEASAAVPARERVFSDHSLRMGRHDRLGGPRRTCSRIAAGRGRSSVRTEPPGALNGLAEMTRLRLGCSKHE